MTAKCRRSLSDISNLVSSYSEDSGAVLIAEGPFILKGDTESGPYPVGPFAGNIAKMWTEKFLEYLKQSTIKESHFEKAIAFKQKHLPKRIYKYRSDNSYARENLTLSTIWLASPDSYNDPYDCLLRFSGPSMASAFERGLIDPVISGYQLDIPVDKVNEAKQSATPLETLSRNISGVGKPGAILAKDNQQENKNCVPERH